MNDPSTDFVTLSVGGKRFETTFATLTRIPDSFFSVIGTKRSADGIIRIDRSPRFFEYIMDYLRYGLNNMRWPDSIYTEDIFLSLYSESNFYNLKELADYVLKIICIEKWSTSQNGWQFVDIEDDENLLQHVTLATFEGSAFIIGMHWLERNFPQSPLINILNVERLRFLTTIYPHLRHGTRPDFSSLMELHRLEKSNDDLATYCMRKIIIQEASSKESVSPVTGFKVQHIESSIHQNSFSLQIQEAWKRRVNRLGVDRSFLSEASQPGHDIKKSEIGVSHTHCLFVSRGGSVSSPWNFPFPTTTTTSLTDATTSLLTQRQFKHANMFKEIDCRRNTMRNLSPSASI